MVLDYLTTKPRVTYLARVRNPNPDMPDTYDTPLSTREFLDHGGSLHGHAADAHGTHGEVGRAVPGAHGEVGHAVPGAPRTTPGTPGTEAAAPAGQKGAH
jgi:molybdopterin-containing oxidoreductase family iron-sulfur binding subunit